MPPTYNHILSRGFPALCNRVAPCLYKRVRQATKPVHLKELKAGLTRWQKQIDAKWVFGIRALLFAILYFSTYTALSAWLFTLILLFIAVWLFTLFARYQLAELLPLIMWKFNCEVEGYLGRYRPQEPVPGENQPD
jgi:hypothetical protein